MHEDGRWLSAVGQGLGWRGVVLPPPTLSGLRTPSLQPRLLQLRLPLGMDASALPQFLSEEGASIVSETARARQLVARCTSALRLSGLRVDETLQPRQVICAAEGLLTHAPLLCTMGCEGCLLIIGDTGFGMSEDGTLRLQWNAIHL